MSKLATVAFALILLAFLAAVGWQMNAFYNYPCEAFKSGYLSIGYAPGRCVQ